MAFQPDTTLGPFKVDRAGLLSPASPTSFPRFAVRWRNRVVQARMIPAGDTCESNGTLTFSTTLGRIPSTAAVAAALGQRVAALRAVHHLLRLMPTGWRLHLRADHSVSIETDAALRLPVSAIALVTELSMFLLALSPYLDVLDEEGLAFREGIANT